MGDKPRTSFLEAADGHVASRLQRFERFLFGQRPLKTDVPFSSQAANPRAFQPTEEGSGNLGRWIVDEAGLPAYQYEMDQFNDPRAGYPTTEGIERRDHWHQVGNQRVTALASNDGTMQLYVGDRGGVFVNRFEAWELDPPKFSIKTFLYRILRALILFFTKLLRRIPAPLKPFSSQAAGARQSAPPRGSVSPEVAARLTQPRPDVATAQAASLPSAPPPGKADKRNAYAGGFGYIDDGSEIWATAFRYRPEAAQTRRVFGIGYFETETTHRNIRVVRRVYAPYGDSPALIADVEIQNFNPKPVNLRYYEYWDVNIYQLQLEWLRSGAFASISDTNRRDVNKYFTPSIDWNDDSCALRFKQELRHPYPVKAVPAVEPSDIDWSPANIFLADLYGLPTDLYVNKKTFFGAGGARQPDAIVLRKSGDTLMPDAQSDPMPYCFVMRRDVTLQPNERVSLRYAYGTVRPDESLDFLTPYKIPLDAFSQTLISWKENLAYFYSGEDPVLHREMAWHAYYLLSSTVYMEFHKAHVVPQGSAYLYLHGADGAPRDQALFVLSATYLNPELARDMLRLIMQVTDAETGQITYAFGGHGFISNGLNLHTQPSDLDLFFLLALCEYLSATGDFDFLSEKVPFYPPQKSPVGATALDHIRKAVWHLFEVNGVGDHGLIKVGSGDWSDSIVLESALKDGVGPFGVTYENSKLHGESVPNTQMALYVLPLLAEILKDHDAGLRDYIYDAANQPARMTRLRAAVQAQWNEKGWYHRAILRDFRNNPVVVGDFGLEAQAWALISAEPSEDGRTASLIENIDQFLDRPSPIGAALVAGGMVWPAVSQLVTWGYTRTNRHQLAWRSLNRNTYAMHSSTYPNIWINTWSGPDGVNGPMSEFPGGTWSSLVTPMTDFPVMNANQDAMALLGLLRVCGIEPAPSGDGLLIQPHVSRESFILELPLLRLEVGPGRIMVEYHAAVSGSRTLYIRHAADATVRVDYAEFDGVRRVGDQYVVPLTFQKDQVIRVEVLSS